MRQNDFQHCSQLLAQFIENNNLHDHNVSTKITITKIISNRPTTSKVHTPCVLLNFVLGSSQICRSLGTSPVTSCQGCLQKQKTCDKQSKKQSPDRGRKLPESASSNEKTVQQYVEFYRKGILPTAESTER